MVREAPWLLAVFFAVLVTLILAGMLGVRAAAIAYHNDMIEMARDEVNQAAWVADSIIAGWLGPAVAVAAITQQTLGVAELSAGFEASGQRIASNVGGARIHVAQDLSGGVVVTLSGGAFVTLSWDVIAIIATRNAR